MAAVWKRVLRHQIVMIGPMNSMPMMMLMMVMMPNPARAVDVVFTLIFMIYSLVV